MQLTRFDRWLREKFVYETHVYTLREVEKPSRGVKKRRYRAPHGSRFNHLYIPKGDIATQRFINVLNRESQLFTTKVVERKSWFASLIAPDGKSVTWGLFSTLLLLIALASLAYYARYVWSNPENRKHILESVEILKG